MINENLCLILMFERPEDDEEMIRKIKLRQILMFYVSMNAKMK
jgi:hypothetical protein